ncbi:MAG: hypothetical protein AAF748_13135 [Pseudomonadota bacterium]
MLDTPEPKTIEIVYDGECPICNAMFTRFLRLRQDKWRVVLTDAREHMDVARMLAREYGVDINDAFAVRIEQEWSFGGAALFSLFLAEKVRRPGLRRVALRLMRVIYPILSAGRRALLWLLGRRLIRY